MKIVVTGSRGQLGSELCRCLSAGKTGLGDVSEALRNADVLPLNSEILNIGNLDQVCRCLRHEQPDIVFNCAAYTNVNGCESNQDLAMLVNSIGARNLAMAAQEIDAKLIHLSTDYVFPGDAATPYSEYDCCAPQSIYGKTKLLGEQYVQQYCRRSFVVRTSWLYGVTGANFVKTMIRLGRQQGKVRVVNDQRGNPTNAADLAHHLLKLAVSDEYGIYHCTGTGECTWYEFACEIMRLAGIPAEVSPCTTEEYPTPARRPAYSALDNRMLRLTAGDEMRSWKTALEDFMLQYLKTEKNG